LPSGEPHPICAPSPGALRRTVTSLAQLPNGPLNEYAFQYLVPGTNTTVTFQGGGGGSPLSNVNYPLNATFSITNGGAITFTGITGLGANISISTPGFIPFGSQTLTLSTLADTAPGAVVLINSGVGQGWSQGLVMSDGTNWLLGGALYPAATRAVGGPVGYVAPGTSPDPTNYLLDGASANSTKTWFSGPGGQSFYGAALSTLGALGGGLIAVEKSANAGPWFVVSA
jgi:hypothetical protein